MSRTRSRGRTQACGPSNPGKAKYSSAARNIPQSLDQIAQWSDRDWQDFLPAVRAFARNAVNFLNHTGELRAETVIDISHEALIRQWGRLRGWVTDDAQLAGEYRSWRERAEAKAAGAGALLTGADLARAIEWRDGTAWKAQSFCKPSPHWAERYRKSTDEHADDEFQSVLTFIDESQQVVLRAQKRERRLTWILAGLTFVSMALMLVALGFALKSRDRLITAEASALWHPLDFSGSPVDDKQAAGLVRLARSDQPHKREFLEQLLESERLAGWFNNWPDLIISAAVGLNPEL